MAFEMRRQEMKRKTKNFRIAQFLLLACAWFGSSAALATERDLILPGDEVNGTVADTLEAVEVWEERYQRFRDAMAKNEAEGRHFPHVLDQEYFRLERLGYKAKLLRDVVRDYASVEKRILRMARYMRSRSMQSRGQCVALLRSLASSREMLNVGYQLSNRGLEVVVLILALSYLSNNCQEQQEMYVETRRIEEQLLERRRDLTQHKETLRQWINALREEAGRGMKDITP